MRSVAGEEAAEGPRWVTRRARQPERQYRTIPFERPCGQTLRSWGELKALINSLKKMIVQKSQKHKPTSLRRIFFKCKVNQGARYVMTNLQPP